MRTHTQLVTRLVLLVSVPALLATGCTTLFTLPRTNQPGFGDPQNDYAWAMTWFSGKLYVGTSRNEQCVEGVTTQFYHQIIDPTARDYSTNPAPGVTCPADLNALFATLQAEIWQYDPTIANPSVPQSGWKRVYQAPAAPNPNDPTKTIGRDIAYRAAGVVSINGVSTMLFSGVTAGEFLRNPDGSPRVPSPRVLATTDGVNYTEYPYSGQIDITPWQLQPPLPPIRYPMGFRSAVQLGTHILVLASDSLTGDGVVMEFNPAAGTFKQVSALRVFELEVFNNQVYAGTADPTNGYSVYKADLTGTDASGYYTFNPVVTNGAGRGGFVASAISMHAFKNQLYVGSCGWFNGGGCELIRINPDDSWQLVVGAGRTYNGTPKSPISGYIDGFNNFFNVHFWRMADHDGALYVGTNDASWLFQNDPLLGPLLTFEYGFDIFGSCDGASWLAVTNNAFLDDSKFNFGARNFAAAASPDLVFVGSANHAHGTAVYRADAANVCGGATIASATTLAPAGLDPNTQAALSAPSVPSAPATGGVIGPPIHLEAEIRSCADVLSWDAVPGAVRYEVWRAAPVQTSHTISQSAAAKLPDALRGTLLAEFAGRTQVPAGTSITGQFTRVGTSTQPFFMDRSASANGHYTYKVKAVDGQGKTSLASNLATTPSPASPATYAGVMKSVAGLTASGKLPVTNVAALNELLDQAGAATQRSDQAGATRAVTSMLTLLSREPDLDRATADEMVGLARRVARRAAVSAAGGDCNGRATHGGSGAAGIEGLLNFSPE